jgi:hypothetical protein
VLTLGSDSTSRAYISVGSGVRVIAMVDVAAGILGLVSAGIFLAHVLEAYRG